MFTYCFIDYKTLSHWQDYPTPLNVGAPPPRTAHLSQVKTCLLSLWICVCITLCDWNRLDNVVNILAFRVEKMIFVFFMWCKENCKDSSLIEGSDWNSLRNLDFILNTEKSECIPRFSDLHLLCNLAVPNSTLT